MQERERETDRDSPVARFLGVVAGIRIGGDGAAAAPLLTVVRVLIVQVMTVNDLEIGLGQLRGPEDAEVARIRRRGRAPRRNRYNWTVPEDRRWMIAVRLEALYRFFLCKKKREEN